jgi:cobalamin synthase
MASIFTGLISAGIVFLSPRFLWVFIIPLFGISLARWAAGRLDGGLTGDLYGALCEIVETAVLLIVDVV